MKFSLSDEQKAFAEALDGLLTSADSVAANRAWAAGNHEPGLALWGRLAELGLPALTVPEAAGGIGGTALDVAVAFERLGYHATPGPYIETVAVAPTLLAAAGQDEVLEGIAEGERKVSLLAGSYATHVVDADIATDVYALEGSTLSLAQVGAARTSVDHARHLFEATPGDLVAEVSPEAAEKALNLGALAAAATLVGASMRMLETTVEYLKQRKQFGRVIGEYQSLKHLAADIKVGIDFARPLVRGAAVALDGDESDASRAVSAAKVFASDTAVLASKNSLQLHGAIGYTMECDLSVWFLKSRALVSAWGTPHAHRTRVLDSLMEGR